jgi:hypothetical protein
VPAGETRSGPGKGALKVVLDSPDPAHKPTAHEEIDVPSIKGKVTIR